MSETDYWSHLESRVCREFAGIADGRVRNLWCDGFIPAQYLLSESPPRITGRAWICDCDQQDEWEFTLLLPRAVGSREEIDWESLLPPEDVTLWLALDQRGKRIQLEPAAAVPDLA